MADLRAFYDHAGGDYDGVVGRLRSEDRVLKFVGLFASDTSYDSLVASMDRGDDVDGAFRAAHSLKGTARTVGLSAIGDRADEVCEALRDKPDVSEAVPLMPALTEAYERYVEARTLHLD